MTVSRDRAKEIFFKYACNHFFLDREVDSEEYKGFGVSAAEEREWRKEYIRHWTDKLSVEDLKPLHSLEHAGASDALPIMIKMADTGDSFSQFWFAYCIYELARWKYFSPILRFRAMSKVRSIWKSLARKPIELTDEHRRQITRHMMSALGASTPEEYVRNYSLRKLEEIGGNSEAV